MDSNEPVGRQPIPVQLNRREFLLGAAGVSTLSPAPGNTTPAKSPVVVASRKDLRPSLSTRPDSGLLSKLLNDGIRTLVGVDTPRQAWQRFVQPTDVVGLKVNCLGGKGLSTSVELVELIIDSLTDAGVRPGNILIWDRHSDDLENVGFRIVTRDARPRCYGNDIVGYESDWSVWGSAGSLLSKAITQVCSVVINLPVLKDHGIAGVSVGLKNLFGAIHNPNKYHGNVCNPYVADVFMLPPIRNKVRLTICEAVTAQYEGGPAFMPQWCWPCNSLLLATDPVALDFVGWQIIENKRREKGLKTLSAVGRRPMYIATAADAEHRLGTDDPERIAVLPA